MADSKETLSLADGRGRTRVCRRNLVTATQPANRSVGGPYRDIRTKSGHLLNSGDTNETGHPQKGPMAKGGPACVAIISLRRRSQQTDLWVAPTATDLWVAPTKGATHKMTPKGAGRKATRKLADGQVRTSCLVAISLRRGSQEADLWVAPDP